MHSTPPPVRSKSKVLEGTWAKVGTVAGVVGAVAALAALTFTSGGTGSSDAGGRAGSSTTSSAPPAPQIVDASPDPPVSTPAVPKYSKTSYALKTTGGRAVDLDSRKQVVYDGQGHAPALGTDIKLSIYGNLSAPSGKPVLFQTLAPDLSQCLAAIADGSTARDSFENDGLPKDSSFCLTTDKNAVAVLTVTRDAVPTVIDNGFSDGIDFQVDLYKPA